MGFLGKGGAKGAIEERQGGAGVSEGWEGGKKEA